MQNEHYNLFLVEHLFARVLNDEKMADDVL